MKSIQIILLLSVRVFHLEQRLTVLDGELRHHRAHPEHIAVVRRDVVAEDLGEDPPVLRPPVQRLVTCSHPSLHRPILRQIRIVPGHLILSGWPRYPSSASIDPLARLEEVPKEPGLIF